MPILELVALYLRNRRAPRPTRVGISVEFIRHYRPSTIEEDAAMWHEIMKLFGPQPPLGVRIENA